MPLLRFQKGSRVDRRGSTGLVGIVARMIVRAAGIDGLQGPIAMNLSGRVRTLTLREDTLTNFGSDPRIRRPVGGLFNPVGLANIAATRRRRCSAGIALFSSMKTVMPSRR